MRELYKHGVKVCVNTDDPGIMNLTLPAEYQIWHEKLGFSQQELYDMNLVALDESFIPGDQTDRIRERYFRECV